jgi:GNAT superfamily N-acetyltransferase
MFGGVRLVRKVSIMEVRLLSGSDEEQLGLVADGVFDNPVSASLAKEFLKDPRHHIAVAIDNGVVVGMASAVNYIHPDKPVELWINEVSVAEPYRNRGTGKLIMRALFNHAKGLGCKVAWVLAEAENSGAIRFYKELAGKPSEAVMFEFDLDTKAT